MANNEILMSGHSQFKNIMYRKGAQDARKAKVFAKISREIVVAVKEGGADPESNTRLRSALLSARSENMPKDNVDRAIKKALGGEENAEYHSVCYEGYGPGGVAIIVEGLTDNKNRTAPEIRSAFSKFGGNLGEANSVSFQFEHIGYVSYPRESASEDAMFDAAIDAGAVDLVSSECFEIICPLEQLSIVRDRLITKFGDPLEAKVAWRPKNYVSVDAKTVKMLFKLIETLEDNDDIQSVVTNCEIMGPSDY
ncbi:MAG: YebC/PmpR family DNA-binding transcriptional regulator [Holosporaceae bacterium]|jgi:YebC/PmpR family DNA-binding regulatory protein|nr:YebC/PmpR family DNA-binding transcriptional regulator [Holosporaceae bacterium]